MNITCFIQLSCLRASLGLEGVREQYRSEKKLSEISPLLIAQALPARMRLRSHSIGKYRRCRPPYVFETLGNELGAEFMQNDYQRTFDYLACGLGYPSGS